MITILAVSLHHFITFFIIIVIPVTGIYLMIKSRKNFKESSYIEDIENIGKESPFITDDKYKQKLKSIGAFSERVNLVTYVLFSLLLTIYTVIYILGNRDTDKLDDGAYLIGAIIAIITTLIFFITIFTLLFNPIKRLNKRYIQYTKGLIDKSKFKKSVSKSKVTSIILTVISFGILGIFLVPHFIFLSKLNKVQT